MNAGSRSASLLRRLLEKEVAAMESMIRTLEEEARALLSHTAEQLERATKTKNAHFDTLKQLEAEREALFDALQLKGDNRQILLMLERDFDDARLGKLWQQLLSLGQECRELNRLNGMTIELGYHHVSQALQLVSGRPGTPESYDPRGKKHEGGASRLLGQA